MLFYEEACHREAKAKADFIESVNLGISLGFGKGEKVMAMLRKLRKR